MTQAPTPGPLSLGAGPYSCIRCDNSTWNDDDICDQCAAEACSPENAVDWPDEPANPIDERIGHPFSYPTPGPLTGRPDADGWMPWSGSPLNPVPDQMVDVMTKNGFHLVDHASERVHWKHVVSFRLAPTAPVEASGSEREWSQEQHDHAALTAIAEHLRDNPAPPYSGRQCEEFVLTARDTLRPQPSGETRELLDRATAIADDVERGKRPKLEAVDMIRELRNALLSARPLALGGQQGEVEEAMTFLKEGMDFAYKNGLHEVGYDPIKRVEAALSTTPARAEAQDEGAAGYSVALLASYCGDDTSGCTDKTPCLDCVKMANVYKVPKSALGEFVGELGNIAAPSPTPAADDDRVREAMRAVLQVYATQPGDYDRFLEAVRVEMNKGALQND